MDTFATLVEKAGLTIAGLCELLDIPTERAAKYVDGEIQPSSREIHVLKGIALASIADRAVADRPKQDISLRKTKVIHRESKQSILTMPAKVTAAMKHAEISMQPRKTTATTLLPDIKPQTEVATLQRESYATLAAVFPLKRVVTAVGMAPSFIKKVCGRKEALTAQDVLLLLEQDAYRETVVPRSKVVDYLLNAPAAVKPEPILNNGTGYALLHGNVLDRLAMMPKKSVRCVVTSTPYWGLRIYKDPYFTNWSDGEYCPYGHEQTPEGFLRHTTEVLASLYDVLAEDGSVWWNVMDTFNTRTQIRSNAVQALRAMQGKDTRSWGDHECRRYSAGHSYLKDGEQCLIPASIAERASRIGYYVKTVITWAKTSTLPEPQESRVSRNLEYILHLTKVRTPLFNKESYRALPAAVGGRNNGWETDKLSDVWTLPTSSGRDGHGAQFPIALPGRCIALSTNKGDLVLDPFVGAGNSGVAARALGRRFIGIDVCQEYLETAERRISATDGTLSEPMATNTDQPRSLGTLL